LPPWIDSELSAALRELIRRGESQTVEFKAKLPGQVRDLGKEIAAFATSNAGTILIGVDDTGVAIGLGEEMEDQENRATLRSRIEGICAENVKPSITPGFRFGLVEGKVVLAIDVPKGPEPVYYAQNVPYVRHLTSTRPADPHEVVNIIRRADIGRSQSTTEDALAQFGQSPSAMTDSIAASGLKPGVVVSRFDDFSGKPRDVRLVGEQYVFLKIAPSTITRQWTSTEVRDAIAKAPLLIAPMLNSWQALEYSRNELGAAIWAKDKSDPGLTRAATHVFNDATVSSVDCVLIDGDRLKKRAKTDFAFIPVGALEKVLADAVPRFCRFVWEVLGESGALTASVGVEGVRGYRLGITTTFAGHIIQNGIYDSFQIRHASDNGRYRLLGFFQKVWDAAGLKRPNGFQAQELV
jgi:hypothetical protein